MKAYTVREKRKAIALAIKLGPVEAAQRLGIPDGTMSCWSFKARKAKREGREWPPVKATRRSKPSRGKSPSTRAGRADAKVGPRLIAAEVVPEMTEHDHSHAVAWELKNERGMVLRVRTVISPPELERVLAALTIEAQAR